MQATQSKSQAGERTQEIQWDCTGTIPEAEKEAVVEIPREIAMSNLPTNDEGENFYAEMMQDVARLTLIRGGEDAGVSAEIESNPWLSRDLIVVGLERSEKTLRDAGFNI